MDIKCQTFYGPLLPFSKGISPLKTPEVKTEKKETRDDNRKKIKDEIIILFTVKGTERKDLRERMKMGERKR